MRRRDYRLGIALVLLGLTVLTTPFWAGALPTPLNDNRARNSTRACIPTAGHSTKLSVSASASAQLTQGTVYEMACNGTTGVYYEFGTSAPTADSNSQYLPEDTVIYFLVGVDSEQSAAAADYIAAIDVGGAAGTCWLRACD